MLFRSLAGNEAERLGREAAFLLVFGSRPAIRAALLGRLGGRHAGARGGLQELLNLSF